MSEKILSTVIRGIPAYFFVLFITRLVGRKLVSQMTFFDFVVGVSLGSLSANLAMGSDNTSVTAVTAIVTITVLGIITGFIHIKSFKARKLFNSEPVTLISTGKIVEDNMKRIRLTIEELNMKLREKNVFNMADVEFAIMETDGQLSVLPKPEKVPLTPSHMNIQASGKGLMKDIIIDGNIMDENLIATGLTVQWLESQLNIRGIQNAKEIFYAGLDSTHQLYISKKNAGNIEGHGKHGIT